ncbi:MAG TPA: EF-hand domain-containing protein [Xanthobacteraceae bacterium]|jgi:hypothetical protein
MRKHVLVLMTSVSVLVLGAIGVQAQQGGTPMVQQAPEQQTTQGEHERRLWTAQRRGDQDEDDWHDRMMPWHHFREGGMMGGRMAMGSPVMMRMLFAMMDSDGDGTVSLQEFQAAHERIFKAMDANKDGVLTLDEIQTFMRGGRPPAARGQ